MKSKQVYQFMAQKDAKVNIGLAESSSLLAKASKEDSAVMRSIAVETQRDSAAMKTVSILGMFFLPGTFVAVCHSSSILATLDNTILIPIPNSILISSQSQSPLLTISSSSCTPNRTPQLTHPRPSSPSPSSTGTVTASPSSRPASASTGPSRSRSRPSSSSSGPSPCCSRGANGSPCSGAREGCWLGTWS